MCVGAPAGAFSEPKIAPPRVSPQPKYQLWGNGARGVGMLCLQYKMNDVTTFSENKWAVYQQRFDTHRLENQRITPKCLLVFE